LITLERLLCTLLIFFNLSLLLRPKIEAGVLDSFLQDGVDFEHLAEELPKTLENSGTLT
jgi:hypothetical protein